MTLKGVSVPKTGDKFGWLVCLKIGSVSVYIHNESLATRKAKIKDVMDEVTFQLPLTSTLTWKAK